MVTVRGRLLVKVVMVNKADTANNHREVPADTVSLSRADLAVTLDKVSLSRVDPVVILDKASSSITDRRQVSQAIPHRAVRAGMVRRLGHRGTRTLKKKIESYLVVRALD